MVQGQIVDPDPTKIFFIFGASNASRFRRKMIQVFSLTSSQTVWTGFCLAKSKACGLGFSAGRLSWLRVAVSFATTRLKTNRRNLNPSRLRNSVWNGLSGVGRETHTLARRFHQIPHSNNPSLSKTRRKLAEIGQWCVSLLPAPIVHYQRLPMAISRLHTR